MGCINSFTFTEELEFRTFLLITEMESLCPNDTTKHQYYNYLSEITESNINQSLYEMKTIDLYLVNKHFLNIEYRLRSIFNDYIDHLYNQPDQDCMLTKVIGFVKLTLQNLPEIIAQRFPATYPNQYGAAEVIILNHFTHLEINIELQLEKLKYAMNAYGLRIEHIHTLAVIFRNTRNYIGKINEIKKDYQVNERINNEIEDVSKKMNNLCEKIDEIVSIFKATLLNLINLTDMFIELITAYVPNAQSYKPTSNEMNELGFEQN